MCTTIDVAALLMFVWTFQVLNSLRIIHSLEFIKKSNR